MYSKRSFWLKVQIVSVLNYGSVLTSYKKKKRLWIPASRNDVGWGLWEQVDTTCIGSDHAGRFEVIK